MKPLLACATAALTAVLSGCGTQTALTPLRLSDTGSAAQAAPSLGIVSSGAAGGSGVELRTTLPTTVPAPASVWRLPTATAAGAAQVGGALGVPGAPTAVDGGWVMRYGGLRLAVLPNGSWIYGTDCSPGTPVQSETLDVMCGSAFAATPVGPDGGVTPPRPPAGPTSGQATTLAAPILSRLGWGDSTVGVSVGAADTSVIARRNLDGGPTADWATTLGFDNTGKLTSGTGFVGQPARGRAYPLISADRAYQQLLAMPRAVPELCRLRKDGKPGCEPFPPTVITGASLGLALRHDLDKPLLVPAWLFAVKGSTQPLAVVAVDPRYIRSR